MKSLPKCSKCGKVLTPIYENNGFIMPEGQEYPELTGYKCLACGEIVDIIKN
jgi:DNA-directed RNA polymerase subunit RPC12/RpoP